MNKKNLLELCGVSKEFPGVRALDNISISVRQGEVHCLVGENGAGKSTLMKIVSGMYPYGSYDGKLIYKGEEVHFSKIKDSERKGIGIIHQELALSPYLSIEENIFLGHEIAKNSVINWHKTTEQAIALMKRVGLEENPKTIVRTLGMGHKQLVEIAKSLAVNVELLIFDEPTAALNEKESENLLQLIRELRSLGITCIMISHKLNEVLAVADAITILRDGKAVASHDMHDASISEEQIICGMVGRELSHRFPPPSSAQKGENILEIKNWTVYHPEFRQKKVLDNISFCVRCGEILGICGLMGAGRTELMLSIFGKSYGRGHQGELIYKGAHTVFSSPAEAIAQGIIYVSEDRKDLGLILPQTITFNISLSALERFSRLFVVNGDEEISRARELKQKLQIKTPSVAQPVQNLSGGNQQKVVLSRCLLADPDILIVDEPTRGVDVGAKYEIYCILRDFVARGKSVVLVSSELPELIGMSDRIYVMSEGHLTKEFGRQHEDVGFDREALMESAIGKSTMQRKPK